MLVACGNLAAAKKPRSNFHSRHLFMNDPSDAVFNSHGLRTELPMYAQLASEQNLASLAPVEAKSNGPVDGHVLSDTVQDVTPETDTEQKSHHR